MSDSASRRAALLALAIVSLIWSYNWIVIKVVLHYVGPMTFSAQRYVLGTVVVFALLVLRRESLTPTPWRETLWIGLAQTAGFQALIQLAVVVFLFGLVSEQIAAGNFVSTIDVAAPAG